MDDRNVYLCALSKIFLYKPVLAMQIIKKAEDYCNDKNGVFDLLFNKTERFIDNIIHESSFLKRSGLNVKRYSDYFAEFHSKEILNWAENEAAWCKKKDIKILYVEDNDYPMALKECPDAPPVLYYRGEAALNSDRTISIVGTRLASAYGKENCADIVFNMAKKGYDPLIVSGLAYGIDISAHKAALRYNLKTIGVLPNGLDMIYPGRHRDIAAQMVKNGGLITEFPRGMLPLKINFIKRNRIIAGMASVVAVIESRIRGGAMSTIEFANSYNRETFAMPGRICDANSYGCNYLISKNMARILNSSDTIPEVMGWSNIPTVYAGQPELFDLSFGTDNGKDKAKILLLLEKKKNKNVEDLCRESRMSFSDISAVLLELELEKKIISSCGGYKLK